MLKINIGDEVVRSKGDYVVGYVGCVIDIDIDKLRARVNWGENRTWVSFAALELTSIPYEIIPPTKGGGWQKYRRLQITNF